MHFGVEMRPAGAFWADKIEFWARNASRRGLLGGSNCILSRKSIPQGAFWRIKLYPYTLRACRRPSVFSPAESAPPAKFRDALSSLLQGAENGRDGRRLRAVRRAARALRARTGGRALRARSLGGWARGALWGYSEAIPNGKLLFGPKSDRLILRFL